MMFCFVFFLFAFFAQMHGFTCGVDDLLIDHHSDLERRKILEKSEEHSEDVHARFTGIKERNTGSNIIALNVCDFCG
jgi:hypothetical protein